MARLSTLGRQALGSSAAAARSNLYSRAALAIGAIAFAGFAPTYYLRGFFSARHLQPLVQVHGILMTGWIVLFFTQTRLIARRSVAVHLRLGKLGAALAVLIGIIGSMTVAAAIQRRFFGVGSARFLRIFVEFDGLSLLTFTSLVLAAVLWRSRSDVHKPLMLCATVALLPPAVGRIAEHLLHARDWNQLIAAVVTGMFVLICAARDSLQRGRVSPAMVWGAATVLAANLLTVLAQAGD